MYGTQNKFFINFVLVILYINKIIIQNNNF